MIANAKFLLDQLRHTLGSPQVGFVAQSLGASQEALFELGFLPPSEPRLAARSPGLAQSALTAFAIQRGPARHALANYAQPSRHFRLVQPLPQQPQGLEPSPFQGIKVTPYSGRVSHTRLDARYLEKCRCIMRDSIADIAEVWRRGSVIASWLLDLAAIALLDSPDLGKFAGRVSDSGEGRWTIKAAIDESVPAPVLSAALYERFSSRGEDDFANKLLSALRYQFGGHAEKSDA